MTVALLRPSGGRARYALELILHLVGREFRLRYRRALLGWTWAIAEPLARFAVLVFLFTHLLPLDIPNYPAFLFAGIIAWSWFASGVASATTSAVDRRELFLRPELPRTIVPIVSVLTDFLDYLAAFPVLVVFLLASGGIPPTAILLPALLVTQFLLMLGIGYLLCAANVFLRDVRLMVSVVLMAMFYMTPVFYSASSIPPRYRVMIDLNPMAYLLAAYRDVLIEGRMPDGGTMIVLAAACVAICGLGYVVYGRASATFLDEL